MVASPRIGLPTLRLPAMALLLLLAWSPVLLFVDHWPAPAGLHQSATPHVHIVSDDAPNAPNGPLANSAHIDHGHGGAAQGVVGTVLAAPVAALPEIAPSAIAIAPPTATLPALPDTSPDPPPPR